VVASRFKDITSAGGGSDAVANSAFWWNDDFSASTRIVSILRTIRSSLAGCFRMSKGQSTFGRASLTYA